RSALATAMGRETPLHARQEAVQAWADKAQADLVEPERELDEAKRDAKAAREARDERKGKLVSLEGKLAQNKGTQSALVVTITDLESKIQTTTTPAARATLEKNLASA